METIEQLKAMRDAAKARIEALPDYKLMTKLSTLIDELEEVFSLGERGEGEASGEVGEGEAADEEAESEARAGNAQDADFAVESGDDEEHGESAALVADGKAQSEVEETPVTSPAAEVSEQATQAASGETFSAARHGNRAEEEQEEEDDAGRQDFSLDTDAAIQQAMAELEADLSSADIDSGASAGQFRYGNSS